MKRSSNFAQIHLGKNSLLEIDLLPNSLQPVHLIFAELHPQGWARKAPIRLDEKTFRRLCKQLGRAEKLIPLVANQRRDQRK
jgi:hypothetical protein